MVRSSHVPAMGSWNTRATCLARSQTGCRVTSWLSMAMVPLSMGKSPETAFRKVDLPAPFEPMTVTNWPAGISSDRPRKARVSMGVPALNVMLKFFALSILTPSLLAAQALFQQWYDQSDGNQDRCHQIQVLRLQADKVGIQGQGDEKTVQHRADDHGQGDHDQFARRHDAFAHNHGGQSDDYGAYAHGDIGAALGLREQGARQGAQGIGYAHAGQNLSAGGPPLGAGHRSEEHTSELQYPMR